MAFEALNLLQQLGGEPDLPGSVLAHAQHADRMRERAEEREAEQRRARLAENAELLALANRQQGDPLGNIRSAQVHVSDAQAEVTDLAEKLRKAEGRLESARSTVQFWADRLLVVEESSARSRTPDWAEQATMRAQDALRQHHEGQMIVEQARRQVRQRSRVSRRSAAPEQPWDGGRIPDTSSADRIRPGGEILSIR